MTDYYLKTIKVGDYVEHRHHEHPNKKGQVVKILDGCNALCWVDFGAKIFGKTHLDICCSSDIKKV